MFGLSRCDAEGRFSVTEAFATSEEISNRAKVGSGSVTEGAGFGRLVLVGLSRFGSTSNTRAGVSRVQTMIICPDVLDVQLSVKRAFGLAACTADSTRSSATSMLCA